MSAVSQLLQQKCRPGAAALAEAEIAGLLAQVPQWTQEGNQIVRTLRFKNYHETMAFVNATAWVSHREDHHPDIELGYNTCRIVYTTHSCGGLSLNDFICAAKIDALLTL